MTDNNDNGRDELVDVQEKTGITEDHINVDLLDSFLTDIHLVLNRKHTLSGISKEIYKDKIHGEPIQPILNELFEDQESLKRLMLLDLTDRLTPMLESSIENTDFTESERDEFLESWDELSWMAPGAFAYQLSVEFNVEYWTEKDVQYIIQEEGDVLVQHTLAWGFQDIHNITIPFDTFISDAVQRLQTSLRWLEELEDHQDPKLYPESVSNLEGLDDDLEEIIEKYDLLFERTETVGEEQ